MAIGILLVGGCRKADITDRRFQGLVEMEQRDLGFELAGRIASIDVVRGQQLAAGAPLAKLDDALIAEGKEVRAREVEAAETH